MADQGGDELSRPRYLLGFAQDTKAETLERIKGVLEGHGLRIDIDGRSVGRAEWAPFLAVSAAADRLDAEAERLGYLKPHFALTPNVTGQGLGTIEFERSPEEWRKGYDFKTWLPCERSQLLKSILDRVPVSPAVLDALLIKHEAARSVTHSFVAALKIAGVLELCVPLDDHSDGASGGRMSIWRGSKFQLLAPADSIFEYFGSHVALYFAWMNSFTSWLLLPAISGLVCYLHMRWSSYTVDDNPYLCLHSLLVVLWGATFVRNWDRVSEAKAWTWNVCGVEREDEIRPEFHGELRHSAVHGMMERQASYQRRILAYCVSIVTTAAMLCIAFVAMTCSLNLQGYMEEHTTSFERLFYVPLLADLAKPGAVFDPNQTQYFGLLTFAPTILHVVVIMQLNARYRKVAEWLTEKENHRFVESHENSLIAKRFIFEAFDCYISLFYIAFVQQDMRKLRSELISLYTVDSIRRVLMETIIPLVLERLSARKIRSLEMELKKSDQSQYTDALEALSKPEYEQFDDFMEMVIEIGYVILFADAFPLAALLTMATNVIEIKSDLFKLTQVYQRPLPLRAATIGVWRFVLQVLVAMSIVTNVLLFVMSEQLASWTPWLYREAHEKDLLKGRVAHLVDEAGVDPDLVLKKSGAIYVAMLTFALEHILIVVVVIIFCAIPACPKWVSDEIRRTAYFKETQAKSWRKGVSRADLDEHKDK